ncbi:MAG: bifunctional phosphoribosyl-AMP cyclohydrolase/phosphoribosyl-ATP diphosphatase HisIE [Candidatus Gastranaerophilales bacterium]|nr:bifunctional phosphoribosyl-AMP cyclohydrolase/phosphoribosyl-ATP diphosphatase HisIE [Candidatus Gastranaerophilales bacterium]
MIIPSIDIMDGKAVQLKQGKEKVLEKENVFELAGYFSHFGEIAVVDIDAAMGKGSNLEIIKKLCKKYDCRVGGGIRSVEKAKEIIAAGAKKIIIGTAASENLLNLLPKEKVLVALDANQGKIVHEGWHKQINATPEDFIRRFDNLCSGYLYTIVEKEGMMQGTDLEAYEKIRSKTKKEIVAAGGISTIDEIVKLDKMGINSQLGMAIYTGAIKLEDAFSELIDFEKGNGIVPTVVQDINTMQVLMVAYSNKESLKIAFEKGLGTYFSRSRNEIWTKGLTSGNIQNLKKIKYDCDKDTLLFLVEQKGVACHTGSYSCFENKKFNLKELYEVLEDRQTKMPENSFTTKLFKDETFLKRKINEEAFEVIHADKREEIIWEVADLTYFVLTYMVKHGVTIDDVKNHLAQRRN